MTFNIPDLSADYHFLLANGRFLEEESSQGFSFPVSAFYKFYPQKAIALFLYNQSRNNNDFI